MKRIFNGIGLFSVMFSLIAITMSSCTNEDTEFEELTKEITKNSMSDGGANDGYDDGDWGGSSGSDGGSRPMSSTRSDEDAIGNQIRPRTGAFSHARPLTGIDD